MANHSSPLLLVGPRAVDFLALWRSVRPVAAVVAEGGPGVRRFADLAGRFVVLEDGLGRRRPWSSASAGDLTPLVAEVLGQLTSEPRLTVLPYANTEALQSLLTQWSGTARLVGPGPDLRRWLDQKQNVRSALARRGIPVVDSLSVDLTSVSFAELRERLGPDLVVQPVRGSSGFDTHFVRSAEELRRIPRVAGREHLVSTYAGNCVLNVHLAVSDHGQVTTAPSVQLSGLPELGVPVPIYSGNDFTAVAALSAAVRAEASTIASLVTGWLATLGYRGIAGVDLVTDGVACRVLEVNPRLQGSTWLLGEAQARVGTPPLLHRLLTDEPVATGAAAALLQGAQVTLRLPPTGTAAALPAVGQAGAYIWRRGNLAYDRPAMGLLECDEDEVFVDGLTDLPVTRVDPLAVVARVASWRQLVAPDGRELTALGSAVVASICQREKRRHVE